MDKTLVSNVSITRRFHCIQFTIRSTGTTGKLRDGCIPRNNRPCRGESVGRARLGRVTINTYEACTQEGRGGGGERGGGGGGGGEGGGGGRGERGGGGGGERGGGGGGGEGGGGSVVSVQYVLVVITMG